MPIDFISGSDSLFIKTVFFLFNSSYLINSVLIASPNSVINNLFIFNVENKKYYETINYI